MTKLIAPWEDEKVQLPVVIWGTKTAAEICYRVLRKRKIDIAAVGDNNAQKWGEKFYGITIFSAEQIKALYPNAFIVVASFRYDVSDAIIAQLKQINRQFSFCRFEQIEYIYETECLQRVISDKDRYLQIINHIHRDEECRWKRVTDKKVVSEYRYIMCDGWREDLKGLLTEVYGIKTLYVILNSHKRHLMLPVVNELAAYGNIGHIVLVLDRLPMEQKDDILSALADKIFYLICGEYEETYQISRKGKESVPVEFRQLSEEVFAVGTAAEKVPITEERIIQSVMDFVEGKKEERKKIIWKDSMPVYIVQLSNGLANQMLMYLFGRFVEEESGRIVIFDDTILNLDIFDEEENIRRIAQWNKPMAMEKIKQMVVQTREKNSFYQFGRAEIAEVFGIPIRLLSDYFEEAVWKDYLRKAKEEFTQKYAQSFPLGQVLLADGIDVTVVRDALMPDEFFAAKRCFCLDTYIFDMPYGLYSVADYMMHCKENIYFLGVWADGKAEDWLIHNRRWVRNQFSFRLDLNHRNRSYESEIRKTDGVMIHIRRGDFVYSKMSADLGYFRYAIQQVEEMKNYKEKKYFIFSDDLEWCRQNETALGIDRVRDRCIYITGNTGKDCYMDMYLMSLGKVSIPTPGSSFSYVAMLISETMERCVDIPQYLYNLQYGIEIPEFLDLE